MRKAIDTVNYGLLCANFFTLGFFIHVMDLIMSCVTIPMFSININDKPKAFSLVREV